ncbi:MAG: hypothetical protein K2Z81_10875, partial [Cyanobacteria bacterium]|nr:hypothetical protein [Cyanobacteriota bacterium]
MSDRAQSNNEQLSNSFEPVVFDWLAESGFLQSEIDSNDNEQSGQPRTFQRQSQESFANSTPMNSELMIPELELMCDASLVNGAGDAFSENGENNPLVSVDQNRGHDLPEQTPTTDGVSSITHGVVVCADENDPTADAQNTGNTAERTSWGMTSILAAGIALSTVLMAGPDGPDGTDNDRGENQGQRTGGERTNPSERFGESAPVPDLVSGMERFRSGIPDEQLRRIRRDLDSLDRMWETGVRDVFERLQDNIQAANRRDARLPVSQLISADDRTFRQILRQAGITDQGDVRLLTDYRRQARALEATLSPHNGSLARALGLENVRVELISSLHEAGGVYVVGKGVVRMRAQAIFGDTSNPNFVATLRHELKHFEQDMLILRHSLGEVARGEPLTNQMVQDVVERYRESLRLDAADIDQTFLERAVRDLAERTGTTRLNRALSQRATRLIDSLVRNIDPQLLLLSGPARRTQNARTALREGGVRGLQEHIRSTHNGNWENVFGRSQADVLSQIGARDVASASAVRLDQLMGSRIGELTTRYHETYDAQPHEAEAKAEGDRAYGEAAEVYRRN